MTWNSKYKNYGAFFRGTYFHDFVLNNKDTSTTSGFNDAAKDRVDNNITLLDAFVYGSFHSFGERNLNVRLGQQVVSWGESTFLQNGINIINPVDVSKLRIPGSELKEALLPTPMVWASQDLSDASRWKVFILSKATRPSSIRAARISAPRMPYRMAASASSSARAGALTSTGPNCRLP